MLRNRETAEDGVAELMAAEQARRRHDPPHAECRTDLFSVPAAARSCAKHFLQRNDIGADRFDHRGDPFGPRSAVEAAAAMDIVSGNAQ